jgi:hypothetical protein
MRLGLRQRFQTALAKPDEDPLVRLGALYHLEQRADPSVAIAELLKVMGPPDVCHLDPEDLSATIFRLHAAVLLAQRSVYEGVQWILHQWVLAPTQESRALAEVALRNCTQFPLAVLLAQGIARDQSTMLSDGVQLLMQRSEDELFALSNKSEAEQQDALITLAAQIDASPRLPGPQDLQLAMGVVISRPVQKDFGFRYTGFIAVDCSDDRTLVVPYDLADVLNRDDRHAQQTVWYLLGESGRRVVVAHHTSGDCEAQALYALPFAPLMRADMDRLITRLTAGAHGLEVAVLVERLSDDKSAPYRLLTAGGRTLVQRYRAEHQQRGNCFFLHELNGDKPVSTRYRLPESEMPGLLRRFVDNTRLDLAVHVHCDERSGSHTLISRNGDIYIRQGDCPPTALYVVEHAPRGPSPFPLPADRWPAADRLHVLAQFFARRPDAYGAVVGNLQAGDGKPRARVVQAQLGRTVLVPTANEVPPGTLVLCESQEEGVLTAKIMDGYRLVDGCPDCFDTGFRVCGVCAGTGRVICPDCSGSRSLTCPDCGGSGKTKCGHCEGGRRRLKCTKCESGYWRSGKQCPKCGGLGYFDVPCNTCNGSGLWGCHRCYASGRVRCKCDFTGMPGQVHCSTCAGKRVVACACGSMRRGTIIEVL